MEAFIVGVIVLAALVFFFFKISRFSRWRPGQRKETDDSFGNFAEQRFLEEDHPVTLSGPHGGVQSAAGRESANKNIGYWGS